MSEGTQTTLGAYHRNGSEKSNEIFLRASAVVLAKETLEDFYQQAATSSADVIYLAKRYAASAGQPKLATGWRCKIARRKW